MPSFAFRDIGLEAVIERPPRVRSTLEHFPSRAKVQPRASKTTLHQAVWADLVRKSEWEIERAPGWLARLRRTDIRGLRRARLVAGLLLGASLLSSHAQDRFASERQHMMREVTHRHPPVGCVEKGVLLLRSQVAAVGESRRQLGRGGEE